MRRERRPFHEIIAIGDALLERHHARCRKAGVEAASKQALFDTLDLIEAEIGYDAPDCEGRAVAAYLEAALGHALHKRPHIEVWQDSKGGIRHSPPPWPDDPGSAPRGRDKVRLYTAEDEMREAGVPYFT